MMSQEVQTSGPVVSGDMNDQQAMKSLLQPARVRASPPGACASAQGPGQKRSSPG